MSCHHQNLLFVAIYLSRQPLSTIITCSKVFMGLSNSLSVQQLYPRCSWLKSSSVNSLSAILCIVLQEFATVLILYVSYSFPLMDYLLLLFCVLKYKTIGHHFGFHGLRFLKPSYVSIVALLPRPEGIGDSLYRFISKIKEKGSELNQPVYIHINVTLTKSFSHNTMCKFRENKKRRLNVICTESLSHF